MKNIFGYFLLRTNWFGSRDHMQQCQQQMVYFLERKRERAGAQLYEPRNQWHADSASKKCQFYEPSLLHTDFPLFYFVGGLALQVYTQGFCSFSA